MRTNSKMIRKAVTIAASLLAAGTLALAQDQSSPPPPPPDQQQSAPPNGGWRRADDPPPGAPVEQAPPQAQAPPQTMDPNYGGGQGPYRGPYRNSYPSYPPPAQANDTRPVPPKLTIKPGTFVTVRLNQGLSSDRNKVGDAFSATLAQPLVVDGVVIAEPGTTVGGHVTEAKKAGRVAGVSHLGVQLTDLTLTDGQPVPVQTQFISRNGPTSVGRDVAGVAATTATGAAIGAAADWGRGAAIGAGAGAAAGIIGVLLTRGRPTYLYPESVLTFQVQAPVTISTETAPQAFHYAGPYDYPRQQPRLRAQGAPPPGPGYYGQGYGPGYAPYPYPYYWGPGFGFYYGRGYWGRGYYRGWWR